MDEMYSHSAALKGATSSVTALDLGGQVTEYVAPRVGGGKNVRFERG